MIYILNDQEKIVAQLVSDGSQGCSYWDDEFTEKIGDAYITLKFSMDANHVDAAEVYAYRKCLIQDMDGNFQMFRMMEVIDIENDDGSSVKEVYAEHMALDLLANIIRPQNVSGYTAEQYMDFILQNTRWQAGRVEWLGTAAINFTEYTTTIDALIQGAAAYGGEFRFRVELNGPRVSGCYIDLVLERGNKTGLIIEYDFNMKQIQRTEDVKEVYTALIGVAQSTSGSGYMTFANLDVTDKPVGQDWIGDDDALQRFGILLPNGEKQHRMGVFIFSGENPTPTLLLSETRKALATRKKPQYLYSTTPVDLERMLGYSHLKMRIGDTIAIQNYDFNPPLLIEARILELTRSQTDPSRDKVVLGEYRDILRESQYAIVNSLRMEVMRNRATWDVTGTQVFRQTTPPEDTTAIWVDTSGDIDIIKTFNPATGIWEKATPTTASEVGAATVSQAQDLANTAQSNAEATAASLANSAEQNAKDYAEPEMQVGNTAPTDTTKKWLDTSTNPARLKYWNGTTWVLATPTLPYHVGADEAIYKQTTAPAHSDGRLWMNTSVTPNILYRSNGTAWIKVTPTAASEVGAESSIYKQATAPAHSTGRLWLDTSKTPNVLNRSTGTAWVKVTPTTPGEVGAEVAGAAAIAESNAKAAAQTYANTAEQNAKTAAQTAADKAEENAKLFAGNASNIKSGILDVASVPIQTAESGARIVWDGTNGLVQYDANGNVVTQLGLNGSAKFAGELLAATGTFTGTLFGVDGTFSGDIATNDLFLNPTDFEYQGHSSIRFQTGHLGATGDTYTKSGYIIVDSFNQQLSIYGQEDGLINGVAIASDLDIDGHVTISSGLYVSGVHEVNGNSNVFKMVGTDHVYMEFFADGPSTRSGWIGYSYGGDTTMQVRNDYGDLMLQAKYSTNQILLGSDLNARDKNVVGVKKMTATNGVAFESKDAWLRINDASGGSANHTSGVYFGSSIVRTDGTLQVGNAGLYFSASSTGTVINTTLDMKNHNVENVNHLTINDFGANEGIEWKSGGAYSNWLIHVTDDVGTGNVATTNYPLQFFINGARAVTFGTTGNLYITGSLFKAQGSGVTLTSEGDTVLKSDKSGSGSGLSVGTDGSPRIWSMDIYNRKYSSGTVAVQITTSGTLGVPSSSEKYKLDIQDVSDEMPDKILEINPRMWYDKTSVEQYAEYLTKISNKNMDGTDSEVEDAELPDFPEIKRAFGLIAEEVEQAGLSDFVFYSQDEDGYKQIETLMYDRMWVLLIPIIRKQKEQIAALEEKINKIGGIA
ncbi:hypothetical protein COJ96_10955 [Bacillus sp. AFS073361]|uniref:phage tail spike protein n=1 Tax=Bacillus sp. AFS073361 TaxID=2033511 RepID=UPI000BF5C1FE|nr:phage tail spike protein [Bacillus sp. AFS073361]PFP29415.1 hypothetical protein COJ96_10955 [Bacillus sp. AFS073361]